MKLSAEKKQKYSLIGTLLVIIGVFITLYLPREQFFVSLFSTQRSFLWAINFIAFIGMFLLYISNYEVKNKPFVELIFEWLPIFAIIPITLVSRNIGRSWGYIFAEVCACVLPIFIINIKISRETLEKVAPFLAGIICVTIILITIGGLIDKVFDRANIKWLASFMTVDRFAEFTTPVTDETSRYFSIIGHPLITSMFANCAFILNHFCRKFTKKWSMHDEVFMVFVALIHFCTASRMALLMFAGIAVVMMYKSIVFWALAIGGLVVASFSGITATIIERFKYASLDSGRLTDITSLINDEASPINFISGAGALEYQNDLFYTNYHSAFEQPFIVEAFKYGWLCAVLLCLVPIICIFIKLLRHKQIQAFLLVGLLLAQASFYPWLAYGFDEPWKVYLSITFIISITTMIANEKANEA